MALKKRTAEELAEIKEKSELGKYHIKSTDKLDKLIMGMKAKSRPFHSTGLLPFDTIMGGGYIEGDFIEIASESGVGKTTALLDFAKKQIESGKKVVYLDIECGLKETINGEVSILESVGIKSVPGWEELFVILEPSVYTEVEDCFRWSMANNFDHIIVDSISTVLPDGILDRDVDENMPAEKARIQTQFIEKYRAYCKKYNKTVWFVNQYRVKLAFNYGEQTKEVTAGSKALKYHCDVWLRIGGSSKLFREEETGYEGMSKVAYGTLSYIWADKCRSNRPFIKIPFPVVFGVGISNAIYMGEVLRKRGLVSMAGAWFVLKIEDVEIKACGELAFYEKVGEHRDLIHGYLEKVGGFNLTNG